MATFERVKAVLIDGRAQGDAQLAAVVLAAGQTHQFAAEVIVVDENDEVVASPTIDTSVIWQIRHWAPKTGFREREKPWNAAGTDPTGTGDIGTISVGGLYTAPAVFSDFWKQVGGILVYAISNFESDAYLQFTGAGGNPIQFESDPRSPEGSFLTREGKRRRYCIFGNRGVDFSF